MDFSFYWERGFCGQGNEEFSRTFDFESRFRSSVVSIMNDLKFSAFTSNKAISSPKTLSKTAKLNKFPTVFFSILAVRHQETLDIIKPKNSTRTLLFYWFMSWATQKIIHINNIYTCLAHSTKKVLSLNDHKKIQILPIEFHANEKKIGNMSKIMIEKCFLWVQCLK